MARQTEVRSCRNPRAVPVRAEPPDPVAEAHGGPPPLPGHGASLVPSVTGHHSHPWPPPPTVQPRCTSQRQTVVNQATSPGIGQHHSTRPTTGHHSNATTPRQGPRRRWVPTPHPPTANTRQQAPQPHQPPPQHGGEGQQDHQWGQNNTHPSRYVPPLAETGRSHPCCSVLPQWFSAW